MKRLFNRNFLKNESHKQCDNFNCGMNTVYTKYRIEYGSSIFTGAYLGNTVEELHNAIDSDQRFDDHPDLRDALKFGYFNEFRNEQYFTKEYVIDNCMHFMWNVRNGKGFI